jgi:hypothetical protein
MVDQMEGRRGSLLSLMPVMMEIPEANRSHSGPAISFHFEGKGSDYMRTGTSSRRWADRRREIAGKIWAMCAPQQKAIALAQGWTEGWVSKLVQGNPTAASYLQAVDRMQRSRATEAGPLAAAPLAEMARVVAETFSDGDLEEAEDQLLEMEQRREARENESTTRLLLAARRSNAAAAEIAELEDELARRHVAEVSISLLLVAVLWERSRRRVSADVCSAAGRVH